MQEAVFVLNNENSVANQFFAELRDKEQQLDRNRFQSNLVRLGHVLAYELSKSLTYRQQQVDTVLGTCSVSVLQHQPVLYTILRAGLPFLKGFQDYFDQSDCGFIGASRSEGKTDDITITMGYEAFASIEDKDLIVLDPMLATGRSLVASTEAILKSGNPKSLHFAIAIASPEGIAYLNESIKVPYKLWLGALDQRLNQKGYIVPGLGDAGDLLFGKKM